MAKQVVTQIKVQVTGGQATPAPPVGTALGPHGVNIGQFILLLVNRSNNAHQVPANASPRKYLHNIAKRYIKAKELIV